MFTGIIQSVGRVLEVKPAAGGARITVEAPELNLGDVRLGDSIAVNGTCLTVVSMDAQRLGFDVSSETLSCTTGYEAESRVNLEKALRLADRLGGHLVSGHVDGVGVVARFDAVGDNRLLVVSPPRSMLKYIARKGSIAVSGVSLTVNGVNDATFEVNLIPHTLGATNLGALVPGARVNLEVDLMARHIEQLLAHSNHGN